MTFVPKGYVLLPDAIERLVASREPDLVARTHRDASEFRTLEIDQQVYEIEERRRVYGERIIPHISTFGRPTPETPIGPLSQEQVERLSILREQANKLAEVRHSIARGLRQLLGDGDVDAAALMSWGAILPVPVEAWRTQAGEAAMTGKDISWYGGVLLTLFHGTPLILTALLPALPAAPVANITETSAPVSDGASSSPPAPSLDKRQVNVRQAVLQATADQWMANAATAAQTESANFGRDQAVEQCQEALNCTRDVARSAYTKLPDALKQPRGKAIRKPA